MRAYRHTSFTGVDALDLVDEDIPRPGAGEVLVRVRASSLNFRDPVIARGEFPFPASPGFIALSDGAGEVEAVGAGVTRFAVGDRVVNSFLPTWFGGKLREIGQQYVLDLDGMACRVSSRQRAGARDDARAPHVRGGRDAPVHGRDGVDGARRGGAGRHRPDPGVRQRVAVRRSSSRRH